MAHYLYSAIASAIDARKRCKETNNTVWIDNWTEAIKRAEREYLPRGSGIDGGTKIDLEHSHANKIVLTFDFHHMDDSGYRDWTQHTAIITGALVGQFDLRITGPNRNDVKEYLYQTFEYALTQRVELIPLDAEWQKRMDTVVAEITQTLTLFAGIHLPEMPNNNYYARYWAPEQALILAESVKQNLRP